MAKTSTTKGRTAAEEKDTKSKKDRKGKSTSKSMSKSTSKGTSKVSKNVKAKKNTKTNATKATPRKKKQSPVTPPAPKKSAAKGLYYRTDKNGELAVTKGDSDEEDLDYTIDISGDDSDDGDYVDDSDVEMADAEEKKYDYGDLDEEGGRYAVLLKSGKWVEEKKHDLDDPKHELCVLDVKQKHTLDLL